jgi:neural Wiskott-Aldrich syndrome protein
MPQSIADLLQSIPMSPSLSESVGRAGEFARQQSHRALLLEHLLLAFTEDPDASGVLRACNVDISRLGTDVSGYLGGLLEDMRAPPGSEPGPDPELLRVMEAARQAAQQSRRRAIDGAIVLAAIVGDGKTPAAGLLKAHGMTFDEAIRTLQKASAQARSKQYAPSATRTPAEKAAVQETEKEPAPPAPERPASPDGSAPPPASGQAIDDMLAAARARIQQRSAGTAGKPEAKSPNEAPKAESETLPLMSLSSFTATQSPVPSEVPPPGPAGRPDRPAASATPGPASASQAPPEAHPSSPPRSSARSSEGAAQPPPAAGLRGKPGQRAERPASPEPGPSRRPPASNGAATGQRRPSAEGGRPSARASPPTRGSQRAVAGPLVEAIPRRMRVGVATTAQVRINRAKIDSLMQLLMGDRAHQDPAAVVARVLTVRLKAPEGGFWIEAVTPETQWIEATNGLQEVEPVSWRWTVTPQWRGRSRMQLVVSARSIGRDGFAAEMAPPDRAIDVVVRSSMLRRLVRWILFLAVFSMGAGLGALSQDKLAQDFVDFVAALVKILIGLLNTSGFLPG